MKNIINRIIWAILDFGEAITFLIKEKSIVDLIKKRYYINNIEIPIDIKYGQRIIGVYRGGKWKGYGTFSGWYGGEVRKRAHLLGYFVIESSLTINKGEPHLLEIKFDKPIRYKEIPINSIYTEYRINAKNDKEALDKLFNEEWQE